ncbi:hypothetical protein [Fictibacillus barbaricus]|uniref:Integral membrane protein n=1 Tax=Fictibacillus barbaricus TaxID=182136 RepID=A0ABU1TW28_9BACL|nr:hypothetical protein [Fictibacillus barbaricus]MDR7071408.1 hypothetical protein [Fictibacillus barbaricus]
MDFVLNNKWLFLILAETVFWISTLSFLVVRYWFNLKILSTVFFLLFVLNDLWIATMGYFDFMRTGEFSSYQFIILIVIVYALTYGRGDFQKLDGFIQRKVAKWRGLTLPETKQKKRLYGFEHAKQERKNMYRHIILFFAVQLLFFFTFGFSNAVWNIQMDTLFHDWYDQVETDLFYKNIIANNITRLWALILTIDIVVSFSYTLFLKKDKSTTHAI